MPPKPRAPRKASAKDNSIKNEAKASAKDVEMPPPPDPLPPTGILGPEMNALSGCLRNAVVKTGQVYSFYADARRLGIQRYASSPPVALTTSLGREVEKFDQLMDGIESHLLRAVTVLQRDLGRERKHLQDAEKAAVASRTRSKSLSLSPTSTRIPLPGSSTAAVDEMVSAEPLANEAPSSSGQMSPPPTSGGSVSSSGAPGRRGSTISLSSLHRPAFPHKLDLSSNALRMTAEEASLFSSGPLASPVTLAPKSARPSASTDIHPDLIAAFEAASDSNNQTVDIDLTVPDTEASNVNVNHPGRDVDMSMNAALGNSADKPIELDLDSMDLDMANMSNMTDLFGDTTEDGSAGADGLFSPPPADQNLPMVAGPDGKPSKQDNMRIDIIDALSAVGDANEHSDLFASFSQNNDQNHLLGAPVGTSSSAAAPSPRSILASFAAPQMNTDNSLSDTYDLPTSDAPFDLMADIEELLNSGGFGPST